MENVENQINAADRFLKIEYELSDELSNLTFPPLVRYVYKPLVYARELHETFVRRYLSDSDNFILFVGMGPGPFGMCQTGIPFGNVGTVREWFNVIGDVGQPEEEHPKRPVLGLNLGKEEQSGKRFWGLMRTISTTPENFFKHSFVYNLLPLQFISESGSNLTPKDIPRGNEIDHIMSLCGKALIRIVETMRVKTIIGIGNYAYETANRYLKRFDNIKVIKIPHPSLRGPKYRNTWEVETRRILDEHQITQFLTGDM